MWSFLLENLDCIGKVTIFYFLRIWLKIVFGVYFGAIFMIL